MVPEPTTFSCPAICSLRLDRRAGSTIAVFTSSASSLWLVSYMDDQDNLPFTSIEPFSIPDEVDSPGRRQRPPWVT